LVAKTRSFLFEIALKLRTRAVQYFTRSTSSYRVRTIMGAAPGVLGNTTSKPRLHTATVPTALRKSLGTPVDIALTFDELIERFGMIFVLQGVPQNPGPFGAGALVN